MRDFRNTLPQSYEQENDDGTVDTIPINWPPLTRGFQDIFLYFIITYLQIGL